MIDADDIIRTGIYSALARGYNVPPTARTYRSGLGSVLRYASGDSCIVTRLDNAWRLYCTFVGDDEGDESAAAVTAIFPTNEAAVRAVAAFVAAMMEAK